METLEYNTNRFALGVLENSLRKPERADVVEECVSFYGRRIIVLVLLSYCYVNSILFNNVFTRKYNWKEYCYKNFRT